ncbi:MULTISPECIES: LysR family transcriptional regulator [unclassified Oleiphilus]|jgi:DNA-binding transcriptional LysR family regulator|nr:MULTISPECIES: LysR family transcriptional regulator [unclassified Oleiphilus]KZY74433.1 LysR family transcriptional regulator [Oleiphilus sp. HI0068]KZY88221.1 LysR family transcriptional regulator [Oleiphilus sp. HI0069]KZY89020.1 LysR family transcriptional regulator [Oleiphilus sp. HI0072]KZZ10192.1 LysR family transcriptional regulator [Oleiphilus sp. HI0078]KZZ19464.1 LysR family transcriptional regulator [Oleiphilus sp. HI0081]KZZ41335.1 LysR family transcriptional regulator [Oleiphi
MQLQKIDLNLFIVFDVIYRERNLTKAAESLHITQPAVSNSLSRLRRVFDDPLFVRQSGHMVPTPLADNIISRVRAALAGLESSITEHDDFNPETSDKKFSFAMNDTSESYLLPILMSYLQEHAPGISIESFPVARSELSREFATGQLDFALDVPLVNDPQLVNESLAQDRFVCVASHDHPSLDGKSLTLEQYLSSPHIHISSRRRGQGYIDLHLNRQGLQRDIRLRVQHSRAAPPIAAQTNMLLTIPETLAKDHKLAIYDLPFELPDVDWHLYWHSNYSQDKAHQWMRSVIIDIFNQEIS